jgi:AcrR family transcriptional regulator
LNPTAPNPTAPNPTAPNSTAPLPGATASLPATDGVQPVPGRRRPDPTRRSERARRAILQSAWELSRGLGHAKLTIEAVAAHAGVGKQTIYRWWPSKGALLLDALQQEAPSEPPVPDTGDLVADVCAHVSAMVRLLADEDYGRQIAGLISEAQRDPDFQPMLARHWSCRHAAIRKRFQRAQQEGHLRADVDLDAAVDMAYGPVFHRMLVGVAPLDATYAAAHADLLIRGLRPHSGER